MNRFILDADESLEKLCGEIFLTTKGRILFHCTLCEKEFYGFESYQTHLNEDHLWKNLKFEIDEIDIAADAASIHTFSQISFNNTEPKTENLLDVAESDEKFEDEILRNELSNVSYLSPKINNEEIEKSNYTHYQTGSNSIDPKQEKLSSVTTFGTNLNNEVNNSLRESNSTKETWKNDKLVTELPVRKIIKRIVYKTQTISEKERKYKCPICGFGFKEKCNLNHHIKRHSHERKYACVDCDKRFYSSTELNTHRKGHTLERNLLCTECGETFATKSRLGAHLKRHRGQKDYFCQHPGCKKAFYNAQYLKNHMLSHSSEKRFSCSKCDAAFKQGTALKNHLKLHENRREYKCKICKAEFNQSAGLYSHMKSVHKSIK